ncbi:MAG: hypothetical protein KIT18_00640 [Burkholderiales bacterium]|nr:hypothetical protein [Burkholderiales bacterium]
MFLTKNPGKRRAIALTNNAGRHRASAAHHGRGWRPGFSDMEPWCEDCGTGRNAQEVIAKINTAIVNALKLPETRQAFDKIGYQVIGNTQEPLPP